MTYPTVNNVVTDAAGNPVANATVVISLVGAPAFSTDVQAEIINTAAVYTDATGKWSTTLKPNALITPSGTYYLVQEPGGVNWTIVVPNDTATHTLQSLLVVGPNAPAGLPGVVRYDQAQTLSGPQQTQALANIGGATAASVTAETTRAQNAEALRAQLWAPATAYATGQPVLAPDGTTLSRIASGTSRASFDSTEQAAWNIVATKAGTLEQIALSATYGLSLKKVTKTATYTAAAGDLVQCDTTGGTFGVTIPLANSVPAGTPIAVKWVAGSTAPTGALSGSDHVNTSAGGTTLTFSLANQGFVLVSDGTSVWSVISDDLPLTQLDGRYLPPNTVADYAVATRKTSAPNGLQWTTKEELVARALNWFIVTDARWSGGADPTGATDSAPAIGAAVAAAQTQGYGTVWFPPGTYLVLSTQRTTATTTYAASDGHAIVVNGSNITLCGAGLNESFIVHKGYGNVDPTVTWQTVGGNVWRGCGVYIRSGSNNFNFYGLDLNGSTHTTGNNVSPANVSTGDGWDTTHQGVAFETNGAFTGARIIDSRIHGYRGETIVSNGNSTGTLVVRGNECYDSNGNGFSATRDMLVEDNYFHDFAGQGVEITYTNAPCIVRLNRAVNCIKAGISILPTASGVVGPLRVQNNIVQNCSQGGIYFPSGLRNALVEDNTMIDCGQGASYYAFLAQTASGYPIKDVQIRRNTVRCVAANISATSGTFAVTDSGPYGATNVTIENNLCEVTADAVTAGVTLSVPYNFTGITTTGNNVIRDNRALGTQYQYTDQTSCQEVLLTSTSNTNMLKIRPNRLTRYRVHVMGRVVTAATTVSLQVQWYDASGALQNYYILNAVSSPVGSIVTAPIFITARGNSESEYLKVWCAAGTANQVYITAQIEELG